MDTAAVDCLILGGGVGGLWLLNALRQAGYSAVLLHDSPELGGLQTLNCAGLVQGGLRVNRSPLARQENLAAMPALWQDCLQGQGELDLQAVRQLGHAQHLWMSGGLAARASLLVAARLQSGPVRHLKRGEWPAPFDHADFRGDLYQLDYPVLDCASLVAELARPHLEHIYQVGQHDLHIETDDQRNTRAVFIRRGKVQLRLHPRHFFMAAGSGNAGLLQDLGISTPLMARLPVHMTCVQHPQLPTLHGHALGLNGQPQLTISTHSAQGEALWYIGGEIATQGVDRDESLQIRAVREALKNLWPWLDLQGARFRTLLLDQVYPLRRTPWQPEQAHVHCLGNNWLVWPTRLMLAPNAAHQVLAQLQQKDEGPRHSQPTGLPMARPRPGQPLWEKLLARS